MILISARRPALLVAMFVSLATLAISSLDSTGVLARQPERAGEATGQPRGEANTKQAISQAVEFLISQQAQDGAWHSDHYGAMKQGAANTSLVLYALSHLPADQLQTHADAIANARRFLLAGIEKRGCVANPDGSLDYPIYSTALILTAHKRIDLKLTPTQIKAMVQYLLASQCMERRGFNTENPNHGGWDILGPGSTAGKTAGANVSVTLYVVQALSQFQKTTDRPSDEPAKQDNNSGDQNTNSKLDSEIDETLRTSLAAAKQWCDRISANSLDGGFYFTSQRKSTLNKAGWNDHEMNSPRAYGSATCDGLSLLLMLGETATDKPGQKTIDWLTRHPGVDSVPGFKSEVDQIGWPASLRFYYVAAISRSLDLLGKDQAISTREAIVKQLLETQLDSGAWKNQSSHMRENDELIATPFALIALLNCLK